MKAIALNNPAEGKMTELVSDLRSVNRHLFSALDTKAKAITPRST